MRWRLRTNLFHFECCLFAKVFFFPQIFLSSKFRFQINGKPRPAYRMWYILSFLLATACIFFVCDLGNRKFDNHFHFTCISEDKKKQQTNHFFNFSYLFFSSLPSIQCFDYIQNSEYSVTSSSAEPSKRKHIFDLNATRSRHYKHGKHSYGWTERGSYCFRYATVIAEA